MKINRIGKILFIGILMLVVIWVEFALVFKVNITPFDTYYFNGYMEREINNTKISMNIYSVEGIFTIDAKNDLLFYVEDNVNNKNIELVDISIDTNTGKRIYHKSVNKNLDNLKGIGKEFIIEKDESNPKSAKNYLVFDNLNLKPSKYKYINIVLTLKYENKIFSYTQNVMRTVNRDHFRGGPLP